MRFIKPRCQMKAFKVRHVPLLIVVVHERERWFRTLTIVLDCPIIRAIHILVKVSTVHLNDGQS